MSEASSVRDLFLRLGETPGVRSTRAATLFRKLRPADPDDAPRIASPTERRAATEAAR